jgi:hypothetical protein
MSCQGTGVRTGIEVVAGADDELWLQQLRFLPHERCHLRLIVAAPPAPVPHLSHFVAESIHATMSYSCLFINKLHRRSKVG